MTRMLDDSLAQPRSRDTMTMAIGPTLAACASSGSASASRGSLSCALLMATLTALLTGCAAERGDTGVTRRDSAGVHIVENTLSDSAGVPWWTLVAEPRLDVGAVEGSESEILFRVVDAIRLSDGRVVIANAGSSQIRYYAADGTHRVTIGREGSGPGEFQRITGLLRMPADSIAVMDGGARRVTVLTPNGAIAREVVGSPGTSVLGRREDGSWVAQSTAASPNRGIGSGLVRSSVIYVTLGSGGGQVEDTLGQFPGNERVVRIAESGGTITSIQILTPPFAKTPSFVTRGNDLIVGTQDAAEVRVYGPHGALRRIVRTGAAPQRVTSEVIEEYMKRRLARLPPEERAAVRKGVLATLTAELVPPYGAVAPDRSGNLWVQDYPGLTDDQRWTIYDADGALTARIVLPVRFTPHDIGEDWILGRELDDLDVEHVRLYAITH
jgi:hypothetical protein